MKRQHEADVNTPERYDDIYFGERTTQLLATPYVTNLLSIICREGLALDLGCGLGRFVPYFGNCEVVGLDFTQKVLDQAQKDNPNAKFDLWDVAKNGLTLYEDNKFDYIFCGEVIEHMENPQALVAEMLRVLKPGGTLIVTTPYEDRIVCEEHIWEYTFEDLKNMFSAYENVAISRWHNVYAADWEHFVVLARKADNEQGKAGIDATVSRMPETG